MPFSDVGSLNKRFGAAGRIAIRAGNGGLPVVAMAGPHGACEVSLYGGHVLSYRPLGQSPVLFTSSKAVYEIGRPIRGGIPVCWPWFGPHPKDKNKPAHGFARLMPWTLLAAEYNSHLTEIRLALVDSEQTRALWPHSFHLTLRIVLDTTLRIELISRSRDKEPVVISEALHTYLQVRDVTKVEVLGLEKTSYYDSLTGKEVTPHKAAPIRITGETDRVYHDAGDETAVDDAGLGRRIVLAKRGSHSTVVWNPWIEKSKRLGDFDPAEYPQMICVETANARQDAFTLPPGEDRVMELIIRSELKTP